MSQILFPAPIPAFVPRISPMHGPKGARASPQISTAEKAELTFTTQIKALFSRSRAGMCIRNPSRTNPQHSITAERADAVFAHFLKKHRGAAVALLNCAHKPFSQKVITILPSFIKSLIMWAAQASPDYIHIPHSTSETPSQLTKDMDDARLVAEWNKLGARKASVLNRYRAQLEGDSNIGFINGILNLMRGVKTSVSELSKLVDGGNLRYVYNATNLPIIDLINCFLGHLRITTPPVDLLLKQWEVHAKKYGPDVPFVQICHSHGGLLVAEALEKAPEHIRKQIVVIAINSAAVIDQKKCLAVANVMSEQDFIPNTDLRALLTGKSQQLIKIPAAEEAPFIDHQFLSPTFIQSGVMKKLIDAYHNQAPDSLPSLLKDLT